MSKIKESPLFWPAKLNGDILEVLDETLIPDKLHYVKVRNIKGSVDVIKEMKTRAFGQFLVVLNAFILEINKTKKISEEKMLEKIKTLADKLNKSRPTFPFSEVTGIVVHWAMMAREQGVDIRPLVKKNIEGYLKAIRMRRLERVEKIADIIKDGDRILTHCNVSGELAMAAAICKTQKKEVHFFATETRPFFQGAKLTCWELQQMKAKVTLIADNAVGSLMSDGLVNKVIVGSDRCCANGDFANKIGTYQIAVVAEYFKVPMYVLTQPSNKIKSGKDIPVEIRKPDELLKFNGKKIIRGAINAFYPGFDVVPHSLITGTIPIKVS